MSMLQHKISEQNHVITCNYATSFNYFLNIHYAKENFYRYVRSCADTRTISLLIKQWVYDLVWGNY